MEVTLAGLGETEDGSLQGLRFVNEKIVAVGNIEVTVDGIHESGACAGDSGGPLLARGNDGKAGVIGVLDRGSSSCVGRDVYLRVDRLRSWALEVMTRDCAR